MYRIKEVIDLEKDLVRLFVEIPLIVGGSLRAFGHFKRKKKLQKAKSQKFTSFCALGSCELFDFWKLQKLLEKRQPERKCEISP